MPQAKAILLKMFEFVIGTKDSDPRSDQAPSCKISRTNDDLKFKSFFSNISMF